MAHELYHTILLIAAGINFLIAFVLLYNNIWYRYYGIYCRARILVALCYVVFAAGFAMHAYLEWRTSWPAAASTLSVSYFHVGAVLFGWSHTSLLRPDYLTRKIVVRDLTILVAGLISYWTALVSLPLYLFHFSFIIFFVHASTIAFIFYYTYFQVRRNLMQMPADEKAPKWWTPETKRTVLSGHHSFVISCHLIVLFGIGSIVVTAIFPHRITPYTVLLCLGIAVFCYIFYSLAEYGNVIDAATYATEDAEKQ